LPSGDLPDNELGAGHACSEFVPPIAKLGPHSLRSAMLLPGDDVPRSIAAGIFVARHGSGT